MSTSTAPSGTVAREPWRRPQVLLAIAGFLVFAAVVLSRSSALLEPDDYAYRASIVALRHGRILLSNRQYLSLAKSLASSGAQGIMQWHHTASGSWISEKNPGYPFVAVLFYALGLLRAAPLFYGALACAGLYAGARKWLGGWGGTFAVWVYCFSGAAITFAWRDTMPSFTDASLIAAGLGALLWVMLSVEASPRRRLWIGAGAFVAIETAVFIRYTNLLELFLAVMAVILFARPCRLRWRTVATWMATAAVFGIGVLAFDSWAYGAATSTGYSAGEISFSLSSFWPNLKGMPEELTTSMPMWLLAGVALGWIVVRGLRHRTRDVESSTTSHRRDLLVASVLAVGWLGLWVLYLNYSWTASIVSGHGGAAGGGAAGAGAQTVHVIRFYLPAIGFISLLAAWLLTRLNRVVSWSLVAALALCALLSFHSMAAGGMSAGPGGGHGGFPGGGPPGGPAGTGTGQPYGPSGTSSQGSTPPPRGTSSPTGAQGSKG